jgi:high affinity Mn2+ porin
MPNAESLQTNFSQNSFVGEVQRRFTWGDRPGAVRLLAFVDRGNFATYDDALAQAGATHTVPTLAPVRRGADKPGWAANVEQELAPGWGTFARVSANDGRVEAIEFTEINRSVAAGLSVKGVPWHRADDTVGLAGVVNGMSSQAKAYLAAGGNGILIGDGQLPHYAQEQIVEAYYAAHLAKYLTVSADFQHISNPAYNADRGPVKVFGLRVHAEF